jgi:CP family cyanate transporter-like MFS transporter
MSIGIAVANVLVPSIIKNGFAKPGAMLGWYTMALSASGAVGAALTVPLEGPLGSWRWALAAWAVPMFIAAIVWAPIALRTRTPPPRDANRPRVTLWRDRTSWWITALFACQALMFYSVFSWVPDILRDAGDSSATAGVLLSVVLLLGIPASALVPPLAARLPDQRRLAIGSFAMWATGLTGLLVSPGTASIVWMVALGLGQGSGIALALTLVVLRSPDGEHAAVLSGMVQGVGYTFAALGPIVVGLIHDATGGWEASLAILLGISCGFLVFGLLAGGRQTVVGSGRA